MVDRDYFPTNSTAERGISCRGRNDNFQRSGVFSFHMSSFFRRVALQQLPSKRRIIRRSAGPEGAACSVAAQAARPNQVVAAAAVRRGGAQA